MWTCWPNTNVNTYCWLTRVSYKHSGHILDFPFHVQQKAENVPHQIVPSFQHLIWFLIDWMWSTTQKSHLEEPLAEKKKNKFPYYQRKPQLHDWTGLFKFLPQLWKKTELLLTLAWCWGGPWRRRGRSGTSWRSRCCLGHRGEWRRLQGVRRRPLPWCGGHGGTWADWQNAPPPSSSALKEKNRVVSSMHVHIYSV